MMPCVKIMYPRKRKERDFDLAPDLNNTGETMVF